MKGADAAASAPSSVLQAETSRLSGGSVVRVERAQSVFLDLIVGGQLLFGVLVAAEGRVAVGAGVALNGAARRFSVRAVALDRATLGLSLIHI